MKNEIEEQLNVLFNNKKEIFIVGFFKLFNYEESSEEIIYNRMNNFKKISDNRRNLFFSRLQYEKEYHDKSTLFSSLNGLLLAILILYLALINALLPEWIANVQENAIVKEDEKIPLIIYGNITNIDQFDIAKMNVLKKKEPDSEIDYKIISNFIGIIIYIGFMILLWKLQSDNKKLMSKSIYLENLLFK